MGNVNCPIVRQEELGEGLVIKLIFLRKSGMSRLETKKIMQGDAKTFFLVFGKRVEEGRKAQSGLRWPAGHG